MPQGFNLSDNISFVLVFMEGILSFFSPCVIPLIPIYMSYLAGNAKKIGEDGLIIYQRKKVFFHTVCFVLGISFAFFVLGMGLTTLGTFFQSNQIFFTQIGGIIIVFLGLYQIGLFDIKLLQREKRFSIKTQGREMNPLLAILMGFTFSFAWTPCVGPALASVLIMASSSSNMLVGNLLVLVYTMGFVIPFLILGLFTAQVLSFLKKHQKIVKYTVKAGGILLIIIGIMIFTGWMNGISKYLSSFTLPQGSNYSEEDNFSENVANNSSSQGESHTDEVYTEDDQTDELIPQDDESSQASPSTGAPNQNQATSPQEERKIIPTFDFTLIDQYGNEHTLSDYKGKVVFLNFWATWCGPCQREMPDIEELYQEYDKNSKDIIILGVANPSTKDNPNNADVSKEEIQTFLEEHRISFPVVFDETGKVLRDYFISAFPTTFMIDENGNIFGYVQGMLTKDIMNNIIEQTIDSTKEK